jgi:hypothetical protein
LRPVHPNPVTISQSARRISAADHSRDTEFARHDRGMRQGGSDISDNCSREREQRSPANIGMLGDQYFACLQLSTIIRFVETPNRPFRHAGRLMVSSKILEFAQRLYANNVWNNAFIDKLLLPISLSKCQSQ